jgi:hypothetical protein
MRGRGMGVPLGRAIVEETGYRWGMSFHLTGRVIGLGEVAIGRGESFRRVSRRYAKITKVADMKTAKRRRRMKPMMEAEATGI